MLLKCKGSTENLIEGNEYIVMALKVGDKSKEVLVYNDPWNIFVA